MHVLKVLITSPTQLYFRSDQPEKPSYQNSKNFVQSYTPGPHLYQTLYRQSRNHKLDKEITITRSASDRFSNPRLVVANFYNGESFIRSVIKDLVATDSFIKPPLDVVIQQMEKLEGGLSDVERRALMDLGEHVGGRRVKIVEGAKELSAAQALLELKKK